MCGHTTVLEALVPIKCLTGLLFPSAGLGLGLLSLTNFIKRCRIHAQNTILLAIPLNAVLRENDLQYACHSLLSFCRSQAAYTFDTGPNVFFMLVDDAHLVLTLLAKSLGSVEAGHGRKEALEWL